MAFIKPGEVQAVKNSYRLLLVGAIALGSILSGLVGIGFMQLPATAQSVEVVSRTVSKNSTHLQDLDISMFSMQTEIAVDKETNEGVQRQLDAIVKIQDEIKTEQATQNEAVTTGINDILKIMAQNQRSD